nr:MAG TPA: hypothetical protein [Caudoviricetes sp.]
MIIISKFNESVFVHLIPLFYGVFKRDINNFRSVFVFLYSKAKVISSILFIIDI